MENCKKSGFGSEYRAPRVKVVEVNVQGVLCDSFESNYRDNWERGEDI